MCISPEDSYYYIFIFIREKGLYVKIKEKSGEKINTKLTETL